MGIVIRQTFKNTIITFIGFVFGAMNTLFLYTNILEPKFYGLVTFILATGAILMPFMAMGSHNTLVRYYSVENDSDKNGLLFLVLCAPLLTIVPIALGVWLFYDGLALFLPQENEVVKDYLWYIFLVGLAMAYFEIFYAWSKVHLKSVFGNFLKEVFPRVCVSILLALLYFETIDLDIFLKALVGVYILRTFLMQMEAYRLRKPSFRFHLPKNVKEIIGYGLLMVIGGSVALILLEIDKFMINQLISIDNVAYYGVAVYISTVIIVPARSMHQISYPLTAQYLNTKNYIELDALYKKTSLTSFIAAGILFVLILLNIDDLYKILPEAYGGGFYIICLIGLAKVFDSVLGNINAILYYSEFYKTILVLGVLLALTTILLNLWLIPIFGIEGAALASFSAIFLFNCIKMAFVKLKFGFLPFGKGTFKILATLLLMGFLFWQFNFPFHPILNILLKSTIMGVMYLGILYRFNISEDVSGLLSRFLKRKTPQ